MEKKKRRKKNKIIEANGSRMKNEWDMSVNMHTKYIDPIQPNICLTCL